MINLNKHNLFNGLGHYIKDLFDYRLYSDSHVNIYKCEDEIGKLPLYIIKQIRKWDITFNQSDIDYDLIDKHYRLIQYYANLIGDIIERDIQAMRKLRNPGIMFNEHQYRMIQEYINND